MTHSGHVICERVWLLDIGFKSSPLDHGHTVLAIFRKPTSQLIKVTMSLGIESIRLEKPNSIQKAAW